MNNKIKKNPFGEIGSILSNFGGLDDLLADSNRFDIRIDEIETFGQVRTNFNNNDLNELANSIKCHGVLQNIIVNETETDSGIVVYRLIAGERRLRAAKIAGLDVIPALVLTVSDNEALQIQLLENIQRENLTAIDLANALERELATLNGDYEALGKKYNKSRSWLSKAMQMNKVEGKAKDVMAVTSDAEVILGIQQIEKSNPDKAESLVAKIKEDIGKKNIRKTVKAELKAEKDNLKDKNKSKDNSDLNAGLSPNTTKPAFSNPACAKSAQKTIKPDEVQNIFNFGDALDVFCFEGKEVPDAVYNILSSQSEQFVSLYEKASSHAQIFPVFLELLQLAGFKLYKDELNLKALIELVILVNSCEIFDIEKFALNARDTLNISV